MAMWGRWGLPGAQVSLSVPGGLSVARREQRVLGGAGLSVPGPGDEGPRRS